MSKRVIISAAVVATVLVAGVAATYVSAFGIERSTSHGVWGEFGDYFGGLLNPLFAMLAFLTLMWSVSIQRTEFQRASQHLAEQSKLAREQLSQLADERLCQELLHVIKDIDVRMTGLLQTPISSPGTEPVVSVAHMVAESERIATSGGTSGSYASFIDLTGSTGSVVQALVREMSQLVAEMRSFLEQLSHVRTGSYAPVVVYYANKIYRLLHMLEAVGSIPTDTRQFFATISDQHH